MHSVTPTTDDAPRSRRATKLQAAALLGLVGVAAPLLSAESAQAKIRPTINLPANPGGDSDEDADDAPTVGAEDAPEPADEAPAPEPAPAAPEPAPAAPDPPPAPPVADPAPAPVDAASPAEATPAPAAEAPPAAAPAPNATDP